MVSSVLRWAFVSCRPSFTIPNNLAVDFSGTLVHSYIGGECIVHLNRLDLNLLVALDALLTDQNVTRAAERVHISQPAMSGALQRLRAHLNDPLLEPAGHHRLTLTPRARRIAAPVKELLHEIQLTLSPQPEFVPATAEQDIRIAMSSYCAEVLGARLIAHLQQHAPKIKCRIYELAEDSLASVSNGDLDFCLSLGERSYLDPASQYLQLQAEAAFTDRFVIVAAAQNDHIGSSLTIDEYRMLPSVEVRFYGDTPSIIERALQSYGEPSNSIAVVSSFHLALATISGTSMVAIVPALLAECHGKALNLKWHDPAFKLPHLSEALIWHERNVADPSHVWFRQRVKLVAGELAEKSVGNVKSTRLTAV